MSQEEPDLRDFRIFDEIYRTRSISQVASLVQLSQPSVSIRLGRLRKHFGDPLFVRTSTGMQPTPKSEALLPSIRQALQILQSALTPAAGFEPTRSVRVFRIAMTDIGQIVILPKVLNSLQLVAPDVVLEMMSLDRDTPRHLESGNCDLAIAFTAEMQSGFYQQHLYKEHYVCIAAKKHPRIGQKLSKAEFLAERHIEVVSRWTAHRVIELEMQRAGVQRNIVLRVSSFVGLAQIVENTDLLAMVPVHLGSILAKNGNLQVISAPFKVPTYSIKQYWHERYNQDAANRWFRELMVELFAEPRASEL